ncbi:MAG TPA: S8 family peptidase, partial [Chitinophagaceae bacterium]
AAYDVNARNNPQLVHVFSSGNAGTQTPSSGLYAGIAGVSNLTGNFKMAKNIITVGAIDSFYNVSSLSSKGPAYDGRVKPELVAFGEDGSSGAAAMVSGSALLVQQAFKRVRGRLPSSAVVKAALINSADDVGAARIDFSSGYGSLNTYEAVKTVLEARILEDSVIGSGVKTFSIPVPSRAAQLRLTLTWTDPAAEPNAPRALVNDLDLVVRHEPSGQQWLPWILNTAPHTDSLQQPARRGRDTLNNVEQVTIDNPEAGSYVVEVRANRLASAAQSFVLAYQIDTLHSLFWTYPTSIQGLEGGRTNVIRWTSNFEGIGTIEYAARGGGWQPVAEVANLGAGYYKWATPDTFTTAQLRVRVGDSTIASDSFVISRATDMNTGFNCADSFLLVWEALPVERYQLYALTSGYLQPFRTTADTFAIIKKGQSPSPYYSVAPLVNGQPGLRSFILNYGAQGTECFFRSFYLQTQNFLSATFTATLGSTYHVAAVAFQKLQGGQFVTLRTVTAPSTTSFTFTDSTLTRGINKYRLQITLGSGQIIYSDEVAAYHFVYGEVIVYPNPVRQQEGVNILTSLGGRVRIEVYSETGALVYSTRLTTLLQQIPAHKLSKGLYIIKVVTDQGAVSYQKLVVL